MITQIKTKKLNVAEQNIEKIFQNQQQNTEDKLQIRDDINSLENNFKKIKELEDQLLECLQFTDKKYTSYAQNPQNGNLQQKTEFEQQVEDIYQKINYFSELKDNLNQQLVNNNKNIEKNLNNIQEKFKVLQQQGQQQENQEQNQQNFQFNAEEEQKKDIKIEDLDRLSDTQSDKTNFSIQKYYIPDKQYYLLQRFQMNQYFEDNFQQKEKYIQYQQDLQIMIGQFLKYIEQQLNVEDEFILGNLKVLRQELTTLKQLYNILELKLGEQMEIQQQYELSKLKIQKSVNKVGKSLKKIIEQLKNKNDSNTKIDLSEFFKKYSCLKKLEWIDDLLNNTQKDVKNTIEKAKDAIENFGSEISTKNQQIVDDFMKDMNSTDDVAKQKENYQNIQNLLDLQQNLKKQNKQSSELFNNQEETAKLLICIDEILMKIHSKMQKINEDLNTQIKNKESLELQKIELNVAAFKIYKQLQNFKYGEETKGFKDLVTEYIDIIKKYYITNYSDLLERQIGKFELSTYQMEEQNPAQESVIQESKITEVGTQSQIQNNSLIPKILKKWRSVWQKLTQIQKDYPNIKNEVFNGKQIGTWAQELIENDFLDVLYDNFNQSQIFYKNGEKQHIYKSYLFSIYNDFQKVFKKELNQNLFRLSEIDDPQDELEQKLQNTKSQIINLHSFEQNNRILRETELVKQIEDIQIKSKDEFEKCFQYAENQVKFQIGKNFNNNFNFQYWKDNVDKILDQLYKIQPFIELFEIFDKTSILKIYQENLQNKFTEEFKQVEQYIKKEIETFDLAKAYSDSVFYYQIISKFIAKNIIQEFKPKIQFYNDEDSLIQKVYIENLNNLEKQMQQNNHDSSYFLNESDANKVFKDIEQLGNNHLSNQIKKQVIQFQSSYLKKYIQTQQEEFDKKKQTCKISTIEQKQKQLLKNLEGLMEKNITSNDKQFIQEQIDFIQEDVVKLKDKQANSMEFLRKNIYDLGEQELKRQWKDLNKYQQEKFQYNMELEQNLFIDYLSKYGVELEQYQDLNDMLTQLKKYKKLVDQQHILVKNEKKHQLQEMQLKEVCNKILNKQQEVVKFMYKKVSQQKDFTLCRQFKFFLTQISGTFEILLEIKQIDADQYNKFSDQRDIIQKGIAQYFESLKQEFNTQFEKDVTYRKIKQSIEQIKKSMELHKLIDEIVIQNNEQNFVHKDLQNQIKNFKSSKNCQDQILKECNSNLKEIDYYLQQYNRKKTEETIDKIKNINVLEPLYKDFEGKYKDIINHVKLNKITLKQQKALYKECSQYIEKLQICKELEKNMQLLIVIEKVMEKYPDIFKDYSSYYTKLSQQLLQLADKKHDEIIQCINNTMASNEKLQQFEDEQKNQMKGVIQKIIKFYEIQDIIQFEEVKDDIKNKIEQILYFLKGKMENDTFVQFGQYLGEYDTQMGSEIVQKFSVFLEIQIGKFIELTKAMTDDHAIENIRFKATDKVNTQLTREALEPFKPEQKQKLKQLYVSFSEHFDKTINQYYSLEDKITDVDIKSQILQKIQVIKQGQEGLNIPQEDKDCVKVIGFLLGKIFALWSILDKQKRVKKQQNEGSQAKKSLRQPHSVQVISILVMFNMHKTLDDKKPWYNQILAPGTFKSQIIEILTGQGKSITLGVTSLIFALLGYDVSVACYSSYLSKRDYEDFGELFTFLDIDKEKIFYGTYISIIERYLNKNGSIRLVAKSHLTDKTKYAEYVKQYNEIKQQNIQNNKKSILLIDEVDQFFSEKIYGKSLNPNTNLQSKHLPFIFEYIWKNRDTADLETNVLALQQYTNLVQEYKDLEKIINSHIKKMIHAAKNIQNHYTKCQPVIQNGQIGYKQFDTINFLLNHGYPTVFSYYKEHDLDANKVTQEILNNKSSITLVLGNFSYAQIPFDMQFENIMGVTGTLLDLDPKVIEYFKEYSINKLNFAPSIYPINNKMFKESKGTNVYKLKEQQHSAIYAKTVDAQSQGQPTLIFFEKEKDLEDYKEYLQTNNKYDTNYYQELTQDYEDQYETIIKNATRQGKITLANCAFGRGVDFICYDTQINKIGGLLVIITFISKQKAEEQQIRGRTGRNGQEGEIEYYLSSQRLQESFGITQQNLDQWQNQDILYKQIDFTRCTKFSEGLQQQKNRVEKLKPKYDLSKALLDAYYNQKESKIIEMLEEFNI